MRFKTNREVSQAEEKAEPPYDPEARYRDKRGTHWAGHMAHASETCDEGGVHLVTRVHATPADVREATRTESIHKALADKGLPPGEHLVDAACVSAELLVGSRDGYGIDLAGPARGNPAWQAKVEGAYPLGLFMIDWEKRVATCPQGVTSAAWRDHSEEEGKPYHLAYFPKAARLAVAAPVVPASAGRARGPGRGPATLEDRGRQAALCAARRGRGRPVARRPRLRGAPRGHRGLAKAHLQQIMTAAAMNIDRIAAWLAGRPSAEARTSRFAELVA